MGKGHKGNKVSKNVFKVAGSRCLKMKNKAKTVATQLKNLGELTKQKTAELDRQLGSLQQEVRQQGTKKVASVESTRLIPKDIKQFEESEKKSEETLEKLVDMSV